MAIVVRCSVCGQELETPGGLAFSPPTTSNVTKKYHLCRKCWWRFLKWAKEEKEREL